MYFFVIAYRLNNEIIHFSDIFLKKFYGNIHIELALNLKDEIFSKSLMI